MRDAIVVTMVLVGALLACKKGGGEPAPKPEGPAVVVKAEDLFTDYDANEVVADEKYRGKKLRIVGIVKSIDKNALDNIVVRLDAGSKPEAFLGVSVNLLDSEKSKAATLNKGRAASFECVGGQMIMKSPQGNDCTVLSAK